VLSLSSAPSLSTAVLNGVIDSLNLSGFIAIRPPSDVMEMLLPTLLSYCFNKMLIKGKKYEFFLIAFLYFLYSIRFMNVTSVIILVAIVIAVGAAAIGINGYDSVYASSSGTSGQSFNSGNSHSHCTAVASGGKCTIDRLDSGEHTGLLP
jgi:hypothetical protein